MIKQRHHERGKPVTRQVIKSNDGKIWAEHILTVWYLYHQDELTIHEIAQIYDASESRVSKIVSQLRKVANDSDDIRAARFFARAQKYAEALRLLDEKRGYPYIVISRQVGLSSVTVRDIAVRNGLERKKSYDRTGDGRKAQR